MNLSKSKYCSGLQCKKILWLEENKPEEKEESNESILEQGTKVHDYAKKLFGNNTNIEYNSELKVMISDTQRALKENASVITEASFTYNDNFASIDILKCIKNGYEIYEVKSSSEIKDIYIDDISYQYYILNNLNMNVVKCFIVYINNKYVRKGELDLDELFIKEDVTDLVLQKQKEVEKNIKDINTFMENKKEADDMISENCFKPYDCPFFKYCTKHLPKKNVFTVPNLHLDKKIDFYKRGIYTYKDLLNEDLNDNYKKVLDYEVNNKEDYINKDKLKEFLNTLTYPLYFLDFETYSVPIPEFDGVRPYEKIPFQYSLHYIENDELKHKEFLAVPDKDPRRVLAESLVNDIPKDVCTLAYNMGFEKGVIKNLANLYPDLSNHLMNIHDNIKDLMVPFQQKDYYTKDMDGSYSIKYVLPALFPNDPELNYKNLDLIHNGSEAMNTFAILGTMDKNEQEEYRKALLKYCKLDTYAMVKIYYKILEVIK